ncbi:hypothetical protein IWQ57_000769 [Coemansia nantahalensis]|uniref:Uncharacterized protein n=1 Tax=Coemansia nantahalensis TaxID=2789366 RepID=A0ACC1K6F9_9FUNG|nr:hypothetical protein IWQ57_000769 [Coemansia nantahalensis]
MSAYPAKHHFAKAAANLGASAGAIFVRGGETIVHPDSDTEYDFHQDSNFYYLSGIAEPGFAAAYDIATGTAILFVRHVSADEAVWIGVPPALEDYRRSHGFDEAHYVHDVGAVLDALKPTVVYMLPHHAADQLSTALELAVDRAQLLPAVHEARVFKDDAEIEIMRKANRISSDAHLELMKQIRGKMNEAEVRGRFVGMVLAGGCSYEAYGSIAAGGRNAAVLHYTANNQPLASDDEMILVDAGGTYQCYASDITRTWPIGPAFTPECRAIYQIVLDMQLAVLAACAPHRQWEDMHQLASRVAAEGLLRLGILKGDLDGIMANYVVGYFMPHGIGHLIGIDTHDVGGYPQGGERINRPGVRYLRARREMLPRMAFTVEPGLYFVDAILADAKADPAVAPFIDFDKVAAYRKVGGVRVEDNIVITESGHDNLTTCPKSIADIEAIRSAALRV